MSHRSDTVKVLRTTHLLLVLACAGLLLLTSSRGRDYKGAKDELRSLQRLSDGNQYAKYCVEQGRLRYREDLDNVRASAERFGFKLSPTFEITGPIFCRLLPRDGLLREYESRLRAKTDTVWRLSTFNLDTVFQIASAWYTMRQKDRRVSLVVPGARGRQGGRGAGRGNAPRPGRIMKADTTPITGVDYWPVNLTRPGMGTVDSLSQADIVDSIPVTSVLRPDSLRFFVHAGRSGVQFNLMRKYVSARPPSGREQTRATRSWLDSATASALMQVTDGDTTYFPKLQPFWESVSGLHISEAGRYLDAQQSAQEDEVRLLGLRLGRDTLGWLAPAVILALLIFMHANLSELRRGMNRAPSSIDVSWIALHSNISSVTVTMISIGVLPIVAQLYLLRLADNAMVRAWAIIAMIATLAVAFLIVRSARLTRAE